MKRARGFTLVEILVALFVVGIGLAALIVSSGKSTREAAGLRDRTYASWVAQNVLTEIRIAPEALDTGTRRGEELLGGERWVWTAEISSAAVPQLRNIRIQVTREGTDGAIVTMSAFRLAQPQIPAPGSGEPGGER